MRRAAPDNLRLRIPTFVANRASQRVVSFGLALVAHTVASTPSVRGGMILNNNFAEHAAKLLDPNCQLHKTVSCGKKGGTTL